MKMPKLKSFYPYLVAFILFIVIAYAYFPALFEGKIVMQSDISSWRGAANEIIQFREQTGEEPLWTNSMFSGMPTTMISTEYKGNYLKNVYDSLFVGPRPASYLILGLVSFYLLLLAFGVNPWLSIVGALAFGFCSYNFQILQVGHNAKMVAISLMPMVLASVVFAFRKNRWLGAVFFGITLAFQIMANHPQITYYLAFIVLFYGIAQLYKAVKAKALPAFLKTVTLLVVAVLFAAATNINHLWPTWEYSKYTMRGGSELTLNQNSQTKGGLDKEYATAWSYGIDETLNLMIPNFKGGASGGALDKNSETYKFLNSQGASNADQIIQQLPLYWGEQAFTAGPMYMGAIAIFLFVLGLVLIKGPMKWWIVGISLLALFLGWGRNFMFLSSFFYDYIPLYNKFRVPSMILIVLQLTIPLLGIYTLNKILNGEYEKKTLLKGLKIAVGVTGGICALFALLPGLAGSFVSPADSQYPDWLRQYLPQDRESLLRSDAFRSLVFILLACIVIWAWMIQKIKSTHVVIVMGLLILADMWTVDKRYLNNDHFVKQREFNNQYQPRPVDQAILADKDPNYRVLDISVNTFNDSHTSYHHKTIGGYSAAKLQRYQDIIDYFIYPEMQSIGKTLESSPTLSAMEESLSKQTVLNMLNTKYVIVHANSAPVNNKYAYGNAWFVKDYELVNTPDEELLGLKQIDPRESAVISKEFESVIQDKGFNFDENATIQLTSYAPNKLEYKTSAANEQLAVFSEIYYPKGWNVYIDGNKTDLLRADYILRAVIVPAGEHTVTFEYKPESYYMGARISAISSSLLLLALLGGIVFYIMRYMKKKKDE
ncbi:MULTISPECIES: YfhO family protein [Butyricimonas]|uniref:YfhO family protein n=1 Tax=Butyricimonas TaxID=574697 RepID=UPI001D0838EF|nr:MULTISPECIES: YfhO family protein [Butyricimonas]MCB6973489.1 YfhO family protein [Butyricimonas synergistica]MCG4520407.1 YfhO family protein [Butyricimonas sp. DFI.6.44]